MTAPSVERKPLQAKPELPQWAVLAGLLVFEILLFSVLGTHFFSVANAFEVPRQSVELGLLALALTPVILTGGIDLSVGSLLGLCAVVFGKLWRDAGLPIPMAAGGALLIGVLGGWLNSLIITRLRVPPLIVTLGSMSLFRGLAEGITRGIDNFTNFPLSFLRLGQGYIGPLPVQLPILIVAGVAFWVLVHRSVIGRAWSAMGYSMEGARYAALPVRKRLALAYTLSGLCAGVAAIIYVARAGQAKADAGTGYELAAITAVVLGGTSIFGGRGTVIGTLLGLLTIATLQNGLRLSDRPPELAGVLTGVLLLAGIGLDRWRATRRGPAPAPITPSPSPSTDELDMRNSQLFALCAVILVAALIVVGGNWMILQSVSKQQQPPAMTTSTAAAPMTAAPREAKKITVGMMPKSIGNAYFVSCKQGAEEAAKELGVTLIWDGPTESDPAKQNEIVDTWITRGVDVIAVSVENRDGLSTALRRAREKGIKVVTWDADAAKDARDYFVNQATPQGIGNVLMDNVAKAMGEEGQFAIITSSLTAANQNEWIRCVKERLASKYPKVSLLTIRPCDDQQSKAFDETTTILAANPNVKAIMAVCSPGVPGAAEAVKQFGKANVKVVGLGLPSENKKYVHDGVTTGVVLWNTNDLGYLAIYTAKAACDGTLSPASTSLSAGHLKTVEVKGDNVMLGEPFTFDKSNIDRFDF